MTEVTPSCDVAHNQGAQEPTSTRISRFLELLRQTDGSRYDRQLAPALTGWTLDLGSGDKT